MAQMSQLPNPHDACFRALLSDPAIARDFFDIHLPAHLKPLCDLSTLRLESGSFVQEDLRQQYSDVLYSLKIAGQTGYLHILIEHVSQAKHLTPFQVLSYQVEAMRQYIKQGHDKLPVVIPLLFYRGETSPYPETVDIFECFDQPTLARKVFLSPIHLIDLSIIPDEELKTHRSVALLELFQKHIRQRDLMEMAHWLVDQMLINCLPEGQLRSMLKYLAEAGECANPQAFIQYLENHSHEYRGKMATLAQHFEQRGMQASQAEVWQTAERKAKLEDARIMRAKGFDTDLIKEITKLTEDDLSELE